MIVARARDRIEDIHCFLDNEELTGENSRKLKKALDEFDTYVVINEALIPNYGERVMRKRLRRALWNRR